MRKVWRFIRRWWWAFLFALATVLWVIITIILRGGRKTNPDPTIPPKPTFREIADNQIERIKLEGDVEKARVVARADAQRERIDEIEAKGKEDPKAARAELAEWLRNNL